MSYLDVIYDNMMLSYDTFTNSFCTYKDLLTDEQISLLVNKWVINNHSSISSTGRTRKYIDMFDYAIMVINTCSSLISEYTYTR